MHELERERAIRVFSKRNEFRTDGLALEECDTELNEHRKAESEENQIEHDTYIYNDKSLIIIIPYGQYFSKSMHMTMYVMIKWNYPT